MTRDGGTEAFYDDLAEHYHLLFEDWDRAIVRQASVLGPLLEQRLGPAPLRILDCACGIGTQAIGLARRGHSLVASDLSRAAVKRAGREALARGLDIPLHVADMRTLGPMEGAPFDAVLVGDNALPHLLAGEDLVAALRAMAALLRPGGLLVASLRDYDRLRRTRPDVQAPAWYGEPGNRRIVHQVWDWQGDEYTVHLYLTWESGGQWIAKHYASRYRALTRDELSEALREAGFQPPAYLMPEATGFYQPIAIAQK